MHTNNCIHRDLKPAYVSLLNFSDSRILGKILLLSNILIKNNILKICDFGISKIIATIGNMTKGIGTLPYMSPELHDDQEYDFKADIWYVMFFTRLVIDNIIINILFGLSKMNYERINAK